MSSVASQRSFQNPASTSKPHLLHLPGGGIGQHISATQIVGNPVETDPELATSWPLRKPISQYNRSIISSQVGQDRSSSPMHATGKCSADPFGYEALKREIRTIFKEELYETLCSSNALPVTSEPSWLDALRRDMQAMFRKELHEMVSSSPTAFVDAEASRPETRRDEMIYSSSNLSFECPRPEQASAAVAVWNPPPRASSHDAKSAEREHDEAILADLRTHLALRQDGTVPAGQPPTPAAAIKNSCSKPSRRVDDVRDMYHEEGFSQAVVKQELFHYCSTVVIILNSIWMSFDCDLNDALSILNSKVEFVMADVVFYTYFAGELLVRFLAFKRKTDCYKDGWFVFDFVAVILYTLDPFVISIVGPEAGDGGSRGLDTLRLLRLGRLSRLTRLLRHMPEMMLMIKGMVTAFVTVGYTLGLLCLVTYVFAIALRNTVPTDSKIKIKYFPTVPETMHCLVIYGTFLDNLSEFITDVKKESVACLILSWLFIILSALLIMNMLIGVLCQVISTVAKEEKERILSDQISEQFLKLLAEIDADEDGLLGWEEFARLIASEATQHALKKCDVDVNALVDMVEDMFFYSDGATHGSDVKITITHTQIIELILQLRGSQPASVKDVMAIGKRLNAKLHELKECLPSNAISHHILIHDRTK